MTRAVSQSAIYAVISLSVMLFLRTTAGAETKAKPTRISTSPKGMPFLKSEAEKWSFQNQIQRSISEYLKRVETNAKELMITRYKFGRSVKIPEYLTDLGSKALSNGGLNGTIHFVDGWANGFPNISLVGENTVVYEESTIKFNSDVNFWKHLAFVYKYNILEDCREFKGQIKVDIRNAQYSLKIALDIPTMDMALTDFSRKSISAGEVHVDGLEGNSRLSDILVPVFTGFYRDTVFPDIETAMRTILEDSVKNVSVVELLPKVDYENSSPKPRVDGEGLEICDTDAEEEYDEDSLLGTSIVQIPYVQMLGEFWAFHRQLYNGLNQLMEQVSLRTTDHLTEGGLLRAKLADDKFLMNIRDETSTSRHAPMVLSDGWFSSPFNFHVSRVGQPEFSERKVTFAASFRLEDRIEFVHDFKALFLRKEYEGGIKGNVEFLEYALNFSLDLETAVLTLEDPKLDCVRKISVEISGLESEEDWFSSELKRNVLQRFRESTLLQIHTVLSQAFYYVTLETAEEYLPEWNYARDFRTDFEFRIGENDEDTVDTCEAGRIQELQERSERFSELIGEDGVFNDRVPDPEGKYFTHVSGIKNVPIRYTSTKTQSWYFDQDLRLKMNEYMYKLLMTTEDIIRVRDLGKARMPDIRERANDKHDGELRIEKCWIDGLTSIALTGVDLMEYDQKVITLMTNNLVYKDLKFEGEYKIIGPNGKRAAGEIVTQLPPMELSLRIEIDYLGEKKAKLDYMKLECIGANSTYTMPHSRIDGVSDSVDSHFRESMVEHLFQIFRNAFEDAMLDTKWEEFLPGWDYKRDYITEIIQHEKMNRFQITMDYCNGTDGDKPSLKDFYPDVETMDFSRFLPEIKMVGLRRSFQRQIHVLMEDAVNTMWRNMVKGPLQRFNPPKFFDKGIILNLEGPEEDVRTSLIYSNLDFQGLTSATRLEEVDFAYGKEDTLIMLYQQSFDHMKVTYNLSLADDPDGEREYGTAVATAEGLNYLLKVRFFLSNSTFSIDEFFLRCLRNFTVTIEGLSPEREWMLDTVKDNVKESFPESELAEIKEFLFILYGYAAAELKTILYTYSWTYDRDLFKIAARQEEERHVERKRGSCKEEAKRGNRTLIARGDIPFIGSEAEWWSFSRQTKGHVDRYRKEVRKVAREFLRDHALQEPLIHDLEKDFARETNQENDTVICKLTDGSASNLMSVKYVDDTMVEAGKDVKITTFITFDDNLKLRYRLEAKSDKETAWGRVRGFAKSVIYKMVISVDRENKSAELESFDFECLSDIEITARIMKKDFMWVKDMIPEAFREDFTALVQGDIKKMLNMAFMHAVKNVDVTPYEEDWNYQKDYGARSKRQGPRKAQGPSACRAASKSAKEPRPQVRGEKDRPARG